MGNSPPGADYPNYVYINSIIAYTLPFVMNICLICMVFKSKTDAQKNKSMVSIKLTVILYFIFASGCAILWAISNICWLLMANGYSDNYNVILVWRISACTGYLCRCCYLIFIGYFLKLKLETIYSDIIVFNLNKTIIKWCFIVYSTSTILHDVIYIFQIGLSVYFAIYPNVARDITIQQCVVSTAFNLFILVLFNKNLHKFLSLTLQNDKGKGLANDLNNKLIYFIIKQTNLMLIVILASLSYIITGFFNIAVNNLNNQNISFIHRWNFCITQCLISVCIYLTFNRNHCYYMLLCKYCHVCSLNLCSKFINKNPTNNDKQPLLGIKIKNDVYMDTNSTIPLIQIDNSYIVCCNKTKCTIINRICHLMSEQNQNNNYILKYIRSNNYKLCDILNDFDHLLECHDSENDFFQIHQKLITNTTCDYKKCKLYSRHYEEKQSTEDKIECVLVNMLDKMHSFWYHSYDTYLRAKVSIKETNECEQIRCIYNSIKSHNQITQYRGNKFNSTLTVNYDSHDSTYSFGQNFEYDDYKKQWSITPKYNSFEEELLNNAICNISINTFDIEYKKSEQYTNTNRVRMLQNRNKSKQLILSHILSLLIYCNCTVYQNKWSATFRSVSDDETEFALKQRHSHFYFSSKYIRYLVENFGSKLIDNENKNKTFYHGVSEQLYFVRTVTQFYGPLSTSEVISVALRFSNNIGIVLELKYSFSTYPLHAKYIKCAFFSDFPNEKECLFIGGIPMLMITNIIDVGNDCQIYKKYINALNIINSILNGTFENSVNINYSVNDDAIDLCCKLLSYQQSISESVAYPQYITHLLGKYCRNLQNILIFWNHIENIKQFKQLFCGNSTQTYFFDLDKLFNIFPNIEQIEYYNPQLEKNKLSFNKNYKIKTIANIVKFVKNWCNIDNYPDLQCIIIHHYIPKLQLRLNVDQETHWNVWSDDNKIILYKPSICSISKLDMNFNKIKQGNVAHDMLRKLKYYE
eukprot:125522_1